jgi:hypothetical protein
VLLGFAVLAVVVMVRRLPVMVSRGLVMRSGVMVMLARDVLWHVSLLSASCGRGVSAAYITLRLHAFSFSGGLGGWMRRHSS